MVVEMDHNIPINCRFSEHLLNGFLFGKKQDKFCDLNGVPKKHYKVTQIFPAQAADEPGRIFHGETRVASGVAMQTAMPHPFFRPGFLFYVSFGQPLDPLVEGLGTPKTQGPICQSGTHGFPWLPRNMGTLDRWTSLNRWMR